MWHMLLDCAVFQKIRDVHYRADSPKIIFGMIPEACIMEFLRDAGFTNLIWTTNIQRYSLVIFISYIK